MTRGGGTPATVGSPHVTACRVGIVGAGQLARMTYQAAVGLGLDMLILAEDPHDPAAQITARTELGSARSSQDLARLAASCDVVTFEHELVALDALADLEATGHALRPGTQTLAVTTDKARMRTTLDAAGIPVPPFAVLPSGGNGSAEASAQAAVASFAATHGWPVVLKAVRGGYDGRGVWIASGPDEAAAVLAQGADHGLDLMVEAHVAIDLEIAVLVARRPSGETAAWPPVQTVQIDGICREVLAPAPVEPAVAAAAVDLARRIAATVGAVGVLAVELFVHGGDLVVNELAARPHNSGHWTIEGATTSQFENHLRAVADLPLGATDLTAAAIASVNVLGGARSGTPGAPASDPRRSDVLAGALAVGDAHVHLYGKTPRAGRKLGHVTVCGDDPSAVRRSAWEAAIALGTPPVGRPTPTGAPGPATMAPGESEPHGEVVQ